MAAGPAAARVSTKWAEVDAAALRDNTAAVARLVGEGCSVMAMVKANGYGHGAELTARAALAGGATWLGVSSVAEALELRSCGLTAPILHTGWTMPAEMVAAAAAGVDVSVFDVPGVRAAAATGRGTGPATRVHWKLDTGMGRLGTRPGQVEEVRSALREAGTDIDVVGIFTHLASADEADGFAEEQHARFVEVAGAVHDDFPGALLHCSNSAALLRFPDMHHDLVRPGIALYGYPPALAGNSLSLRPALTVRAVVTRVADLTVGDSVGYGRAWTARRPSRVATVAAGYADGVDRRNGNRGMAIAGGALCPMVGRVSMDQLSLDVTDAGPVAAGDHVTLLGEAGGLRIGAAEVAATIGTISYEVLCAVSGRVPRVTVNEAEVHG